MISIKIIGRTVALLIVLILIGWATIYVGFHYKRTVYFDKKFIIKPGQTVKLDDENVYFTLKGFHYDHGLSWREFILGVGNIPHTLEYSIQVGATTYYTEKDIESNTPYLIQANEAMNGSGDIYVSVTISKK